MGLFDAFKKKREEPVQSNSASVFTLRFGIPYFQVFDKTNPKLKAFPVKLSCGGSIRYSIADPNLCFDNVPLGSMAPIQLEVLVKDSLVSSVKHFINSIDYLPVLQFERELLRINDAAKQYLIPLFADEYGINLHAFNLTRLTYDPNDENYKRLYSQSVVMSDRIGGHELVNLDMDHEDDIYEREHRRRIRNLRDDEDLIERETNLRLRQQAGEHALRRNEASLASEIDSGDLDVERKRRELEEDMYARRKATDTGAKLSESLGNRPMLGLGSRPAPGLGGNKPKDDGLDLGSL